MFPFPPPDTPVTPLNFLQFFAILQILFWFVALVLPRGWFCVLARTAFPFLDAQRTTSQF